MTCKTCGDGPCLCTPASSLPPTPDAKPAAPPAKRYSLREAKAIVARSASEYLSGCANALAGDALQHPRGSTAASNATMLAMAAHELRGRMDELVGKLEGQPRIVGPDGGDLH